MKEVVEVETLCEVYQPDGDCEKCPLWQEEKRKEKKNENHRDLH